MEVASEPVGARVAEALVARRGKVGLGGPWRLLWPESGAVSPIPALDGLRAAAVLLVVVFHVWYKGPALIETTRSFPPTQHPLWSLHTGVHLFFILSSFLLFLPYAQWILGQKGPPNSLQFYRRRILRVGPAFWASVAILLLVGPLTPVRIGNAVAHVFFVFNAIPGSSEQFNDVFWTMAIEVQFYAVLPLIGVLAYWLSRRLGPLRAVLLVFGACLLVSLTSGYLGHRFQPLGLVWWGLLGRYSLSLWLSVFGTGILTSLVYCRLRKSPELAASARRVGPVIFGAGMALALGVAFVPSLGRLPLNGGSNDLMYGYAYAAMLFGVLVGPPALRLPFELPAVRFIGLISYSLYLWHTVVLSHLAPDLSAIHGPVEQIAVGVLLELLVAIPVAYVSYQLTERPFVHLRGKARDELPAEASVAVQAS